jgi:hypothetical protein
MLIESAVKTELIVRAAEDFILRQEHAGGGRSA